MSKKVLRCPGCNNLLSDELQDIIKKAFEVIMSPVGKYIEFSGKPFLCEECEQKGDE